MKLFRVALLSTVLLLGGCLSTPQWRVAQAKVPEPIVKTTKQTEAERQGAVYLAKTLREVDAFIQQYHPNTPIAKKTQEATQVADLLSASLGQPRVPLKDTPQAGADTIAALQAGLRDAQRQLEVLNGRLAKYQGKEIEGTGVNLFAPVSGLGFVGLIAACIFIPGFLAFLLLVVRRLYATIRFLVAKIQEFHPAEDAPIKQALGRAMDSTHKAIVKAVRADLVKKPL